MSIAGKLGNKRAVRWAADGRPPPRALDRSRTVFGSSPERLSANQVANPGSEPLPCGSPLNRRASGESEDRPERGFEAQAKAMAPGHRHPIGTDERGGTGLAVTSDQPPDVPATDRSLDRLAKEAGGDSPCPASGPDPCDRRVVGATSRPATLTDGARPVLRDGPERNSWPPVAAAGSACNATA